MITEVSADVAGRAAAHRALGDPSRLAIFGALVLSDRMPGELRAATGLDWNLLGFHLRTLDNAGVVRRRVSDGDRRRRYVRLRPGALDRLGVTPELAGIGSPLFVCTHNSARSQFAAALWRKVSGRSAASAGSRPAAAVHPLAVEVAARHGVDLTRARPRGYDEIGTQPDLVVSVCDRAFEGGVPFDAPRLHWSVPDPPGRRASRVRGGVRRHRRAARPPRPGGGVTARRLVAELLGTAGLLLAIVGSGITASTDGAASTQLFQHAVVVGAALGALIVTFGSVSGAHFNPAVTLVDALFGGMSRWLAGGYVVAQLAGAVTGVVAANLLFDLPAVAIAGTDRTGMALAASEGVATFGLLVVIFGVVRSGNTAAVPAAVGAWIAGALAAAATIHWLFRPGRSAAEDVVVPRDQHHERRRAPR